jgi:FtsH-binding integral membrane protein
LDEQGVNDWQTALQIAISLYLDIINLLLELLEAMDS